MPKMLFSLAPAAVRFLLLLTLIGLTLPAHAVEACRERAGERAWLLIQQRAPELQLPEVGSLAPDYRKQDEQQGGNGCYLVATGHLDGNRSTDVALIAQDPQQHPVLLLVQDASAPHPRLFRLNAFCRDGSSCYVTTLPRGRYTRSAALPPAPLARGERTHLIARFQVVQTGTQESTGVVYAWDGKDWRYVWVSD